MEPGWLEASELRIGLGCMRLSTDDGRDEGVALETIAAAAAAGVTVFDTAHAYGLDEGELGHNERLLARALRLSGGEASARIVTKGGMGRTGGAWVPDGRAKAILAGCEASLLALDGLEIDAYLLHAPDPRTPWGTSLRALARLGEEGLARRVGVCNVNRGQLDEALELAPIAAVQVGLSPFDDRAVRGGVLERCAEAGIAVIAHSPLGGPKRAGRLARNGALAAVADALDASPAEVALAWLLGLSPLVVAIPGARRPETARSAAAAAALRLDAEQRAAVGRALGLSDPARAKRSRSAASPTS
jgi:aryl-alcohol dehydrogenase-like predicted oxidoreductase